MIRWKSTGEASYDDSATLDCSVYSGTISGDTNQALSKSLFLSSETIKKRWQGIYRKVTEAMPELFAGLDNDSGRQQESKKKHLLLAYLQHHMQELRPYDPKLLTGG